ncbi:hypothetical protein [uncultured Mediterranean phage uvMED]|nr:hypothetical protein [uncultured Mediterranean phage uvMED]
MAKLRTKTMGERTALLYQKAQDGMNYNDQMGQVALLCADFNVEPQVACDHMHLAALTVLRRKPKPLEIENWIKWAYDQKRRSVAGLRSREPKQSQARKNLDVINEWASKGSLQDLMKRSNPIPDRPEQILETLYDDSDLLHISPDIFHDEIQSRDEWIKGGLDGMQYFCPCTFKGRERGRLADNISDRKYLVFETDDMPEDWDSQCGLIDRLAKDQELLVVVTSGNKSLHATFDVRNLTQESLQKFMDLVITLGGDRAVLRPSQMVRFPFGRNSKTGRKQKVIYYGR